MRLSYTAKIAKGHPENPMTENEVLEKFRGNAKLVISETGAEELVGLVRKLERVDDVTQLVKLVTFS
jgi:hypothetical protein